MLGHMQKVKHFWAQIKKSQNVSYDVFAQGPLIWKVKIQDPTFHTPI